MDEEISVGEIFLFNADGVVIWPHAMAPPSSPLRGSATLIDIIPVRFEPILRGPTAEMSRAQTSIPVQPLSERDRLLNLDLSKALFQPMPDQ